MAFEGYTLPETNSLPLKLDLPKWKLIFQPSIFRWEHVSFREVNDFLFYSNLDTSLFSADILGKHAMIYFGMQKPSQDFSGHQDDMNHLPWWGVLRKHFFIRHNSILDLGRELPKFCRYLLIPRTQVSDLYF